MRRGSLRYAASGGNKRHTGGFCPDPGLLCLRLCFGEKKTKARNKTGFSLRNRAVFALSYRERCLRAGYDGGVFRKVDALLGGRGDRRRGGGKQKGKLNLLLKKAAKPAVRDIKNKLTVCYNRLNLVIKRF